jgi:hypothetical protein
LDLFLYSYWLLRLAFPKPWESPIAAVLSNGLKLLVLAPFRKNGEEYHTANDGQGDVGVGIFKEFHD